MTSLSCRDPACYTGTSSKLFCPWGYELKTFGDHCSLRSHLPRSLGPSGQSSFSQRRGEGDCFQRLLPPARKPQVLSLLLEMELTELPLAAHRGFLQPGDFTQNHPPAHPAASESACPVSEGSLTVCLQRYRQGLGKPTRGTVGAQGWRKWTAPEGGGGGCLTWVTVGQGHDQPTVTSPGGNRAHKLPVLTGPLDASRDNSFPGQAAGCGKAGLGSRGTKGRFPAQHQT